MPNRVAFRGSKRAVAQVEYQIVQSNNEGGVFRSAVLKVTQNCDKAYEYKEAVARKYMEKGWKGKRSRCGTWSLERGGQKVWLRIRAYDGNEEKVQAA